MTTIDFMKRLGCTDITEGCNGRIRGYYRDFVLVGSRPNNKNDNFDIKAFDTRRNQLKEISYVACKKSSSKANASTISDFQYRINELIARKYDDRDKILLGTEVEIGTKYWYITEIEKKSSIVLCKILNFSISGVEVKPIKFHKDFDDFFDINELERPILFSKDDWFINEKEGPAFRDHLKYLNKLPLEEFIDINEFKEIVTL